MSGYGKTTIAVTLSMDCADPDEAIRWKREQFAAALGTTGDAGEEGWVGAKLGTTRRQLVGVRVVGGWSTAEALFGVTADTTRH